MSKPDPIKSVAYSLVSALHNDLSEYKYVWKEKEQNRRPYEHECTITLFCQMWGSTALGFGGIGGQAMTEAYTVIVEGPMGDAAVYFGGRLAYHIVKPNRQFREDMHAHSMSPVAGAKRKYEQ